LLADASARRMLGTRARALARARVVVRARRQGPRRLAPV
jgi:hypothetical protein